MPTVSRIRVAKARDESGVALSKRHQSPYAAYSWACSARRGAEGAALGDEAAGMVLGLGVGITTLKALLHEQFGDGIMSAINFMLVVKKLPTRRAASVL